MAQQPGKFQYDLDGQPVGFVNSDDNKIKITGQPVDRSVDETGVKYPASDSIALAGQAPLVLGIVEPGTASLAIDLTRPVFGESMTPGTDSLSFSGKVPTLGSIVKPTVDGVNLSGKLAERPTGLKLNDPKDDPPAPTAIIANVVLPQTRAVTFSGSVPDAYPDNARVPPTKSVALSGAAPLAVVANIRAPGNDAITIQGRLTNVFPAVFPSTGAMTLLGKQPVAQLSEGQVVVIIEGPFNYGTFIRNLNATTNVPVNYQIDDRTGFKVKVKDPMVEEYTGHLVRPDSLDIRSEQEFMRSKRKENQRGPERPEPIGDERFVEDEYPNGVTIDDL